MKISSRGGDIVADNSNFNVDDDDESGGGEWLNTYADLVTLLLCFFVLLYSMSTLDNQKFKKAIAAFSSMGIMGQSGSITPGSSVGDSISNLDVNNAIDVQQEMDSIYSQVKELVDEKGLDEDVEVEQVEAGVLLRFKDEILFDTGRADLKPNVKSTLNKLGEILKKHNKEIRVEGHTDNVPIKNSSYKSNWELSSARAISVVKYFTEELPSEQRFDPKNFEVSGYGEYHPIVPNNSEKNRQKNRRIEITIRK